MKKLGKRKMGGLTVIDKLEVDTGNGLIAYLLVICEVSFFI